MNMQDIHDIGADGPRAYAPFTKAQLQDAHDREMESGQPEPPVPPKGGKIPSEDIAKVAKESWIRVARNVGDLQVGDC